MHNDIHLKVSSGTRKTFSNAQKLIQKNLRILYIDNGLPYSRIAIQITKKAVKLAVTRNRIRRTIRESFRSLLPELPSYDILVLITSKISSEKHEISDILIQEWILSIKLLQQSRS